MFLVRNEVGQSALSSFMKWGTLCSQVVGLPEGSLSWHQAPFSL